MDLLESNAIPWPQVLLYTKACLKFSIVRMGHIICYLVIKHNGN